jgi:hypothetical protein
MQEALMSTVWSILIAFWTYLPWVAIALAAVFALLRHRESRPLLLQAIGATAYFFLGFLQWVVHKFLVWTGANTTVQNSADIILGFLLFVALVIFALGFCLDRLRRRGESVAVTATPMES